MQNSDIPMHITLASSNVLIDLDNGHELLKSQKENRLDNRCYYLLYHYYLYHYYHDSDLLKGHYPLFLQKIKSKFHQD